MNATKLDRSRPQFIRLSPFFWKRREIRERGIDNASQYLYKHVLNGADIGTKRLGCRNLRLSEPSWPWRDKTKVSWSQRNTGIERPFVYPPAWQPHRRAPFMPEERDNQTSPDRSKSRCRADSEVKTIRSDDLLRGRRELRILHAGETYRLLVTRNNKLILQK